MPEFNEPEWEEFNPLGWDESIAYLWDDATNGDAWHNQDYAKRLFETAYIDNVSPEVRAYARNQLVDWFRDTFDLDWDDEFDWDSWRDWYNNQ